MDDLVYVWWISSNEGMWSPQILGTEYEQDLLRNNAERHEDVIFFFGTIDEVSPIVEIPERWEDVYGYITKEFSIDDNEYRVVFHLERDGYFTGYYADESILDPEASMIYRKMLDLMVKNLEEV